MSYSALVGCYVLRVRQSVKPHVSKLTIYIYSQLKNFNYK